MCQSFSTTFPPGEPRRGANPWRGSWPAVHQVIHHGLSPSMTVLGALLVLALAGLAGLWRLPRLTSPRSGIILQGLQGLGNASIWSGSNASRPP